MKGEKYENKTHSKKKAENKFEVWLGSLPIGQKNVEIVSLKDTS
jgi:hypothetical protein